ncbi:MAG: DUF4099 domain-containing protein [Bacteroidetes bacterium]|nr:DUF4099 domain-containing protein [Bacteroidota bacterium]
MIRQIYSRQDLPLGDLQRIGLAKDGVLALDADDLNALLSGRRTDMLRLENLNAEGVHIPALDAKLSLKQNKDGALELMLHPIHREPASPSFLTDTQVAMLEHGDTPNVHTVMFDGEGKPKDVLVEFDNDTNEFIVVDTDKIQAPDMINGLPLTAAQKERYRKGDEVTADDGTTVQYSATEKQGLRSDKHMLIASILIDGGATYILFKVINALFNREQHEEPGLNFNKALKDMQETKAAKGTVLAAGEDFEEGNEQSIQR